MVKPETSRGRASSRSRLCGVSAILERTSASHACGSTEVTAQRADRIVGAPLAHHADRADLQQYGKRLPDLVVEARLPDLVEIASALRRNDGFRPDSGPSRGDPRRRAIRPLETIATHSGTDRPRP